MKCLNPIKLKNEDPKLIEIYGSYREVPCGKCEACIDNKRKEWFIRIKEEAEHSYNSWFVTLTYNEADLPRNSLGFPTFRKKDVQDFLKRLRYHLSKVKVFYKPLPFRYFIIGEYGSKFGRPHYHCIFFNVEPSVDLFRLVYEYWTHGRVTVDRCTPSRIGYCANYMYGKSAFIPDEVIDETNKLPMLSSRRPGIGASYVNFITIDWHKENFKNYYQDGEIKYPLPRFYRDKIFSETDKVHIHYNNVRRQKESRLKEIEELSNYYQKYGQLAEPPSHQERREFLRKFNNRVKKHNNSKYNQEL